jgi:phage shock protein E
MLKSGRRAATGKCYPDQQMASEHWYNASSKNNKSPLVARLLGYQIENQMTLLNSTLTRFTYNRRFATALLILCLSALASCASSPSQVVWLDVRTDAEFAEDHIEGSAHIPHEEIALRITDLGLDKDAEINVYCRSGKRAGIALATLQELGYTNAKNVGGIGDARELRD